MEPDEPSRATHWQAVYRAKAPTGVSWYRQHLDVSLELIEACELSKDADIVDVGGGASTLTDDLLARGYKNLTVVDLAGEPAFAATRARLGERAAGIRFIEADITEPGVLAAGSVDLWHDRAVFHFLTEPSQREAYARTLALSVRPASYVIIATFAPDGPERCSNLPVVRYSPPEIVNALAAADLDLVADRREIHETPWGSKQPFSYALCRVRSHSA